MEKERNFEWLKHPKGLFLTYLLGAAKILLFILGLLVVCTNRLDGWLLAFGKRVLWTAHPKVTLDQMVVPFLILVQCKEVLTSVAVRGHNLTDPATRLDVPAPDLPGQGLIWRLLVTWCLASVTWSADCSLHPRVRGRT